MDYGIVSSSLTKHQFYIARWKARIILVCLWWFACAFAFWGIFYARNGSLDNAWGTSGIEDAHRISEVIKNLKLNNETGAFSLYQRDSDHDFRPAYTIECGNLLGAKGQIGVFETSAFKIAEIQDLNLRLCSYSDSSGNLERSSSEWGRKTEKQFSIPVSSGKSQVIRQLMAMVSKDGLEGMGDTVKDSSLWIDLGNLAGLSIRNFDCAFIHDSQEVLAVSCRSVEISGQNEIVFHGRVVLQAGEECILRSNHVIWHIKDEYFDVPGRYMLTLGNGTRVGQSLQCAEQLRVLENRLPEMRSKNVIIPGL